MSEKPRRLGRGLEALLTATAPTEQTAGGDGVRRLPIPQIRPNPHQPRKEFRPEELADLEASLRASGLLQPIVVRPAATGGGYELIAGERRLRAATRIGWAEIPAIVREIDDRDLLTLALVENLQRADLNPLEEAEGYRRLIEEFGLTQQQVAEAVGKDRTTITNTLRVLQLPASVRRMLQQQEISAGHARALLALAHEHEMIDLAREAATHNLSVRDLEHRVRERPSARKKPTAKAGGTPATAASPEQRRIADELRRYLQTDVALHLEGTDRGEVRIRFYSADDLERLLDLIMKEAREP